MQLCSAVLYVKDLERMKRFYSEMLGASLANHRWTDTWVAFETGGARFSLHSIPAESRKEHRDRLSANAARTGFGEACLRSEGR
jgi:extradiol dioxygenase family protein